MEDQVPEEVRRERLEEVMAVQSGISLDLNQRHVGSVQRVLVDFTLDDDPDFEAVARTESQAIDVDGITNLSPGGSVKPGEFVEVEIVDALEHDLIGRVRGAT
jgi:ribosomal protein S12 methylthiotransferase